MSNTATLSDAVPMAPASDFKALEGRAVHATIWTIISYGATQCLRLVNSLLLTHLLMPDAFGEMTLIVTLIVGISLLSDIGLEPSVIQSPRGDETVFLNTAWTLQVVRGLILWSVAVLLAYPASLFYHDQKLVYALPVLALSSLITGLNSTNLLSLARHMGVKRLFAIDFSTQIVALVITVAWAYRWPSVWALVAGNVLSNIYKAALSHQQAVTPGVRNRLFWDSACVDEIIHFGKWIFLGTAFFFFASQSDRLILGRLVPLATLGVYGIAFQLSDVPRAVINAFSQKVGYPFISKLVHLPMTEFRQRFLHYRGLALMVGGVLLSLMVNWGGWAVTHVYPVKYAAAGWIVTILALGLWHTLLYQTAAPVLFSLGKSKYSAVGNAAYCITIVLGIPIAFHFFGLLGAVVAVAAGDLPNYAIIQYGATREGIRPLRQDFLLTLGYIALLLLEFGMKTGFYKRLPEFHG